MALEASLPRSGTGIYRRAFRNAVDGPASLDAYNGELQDLQDELNNSLAKDGSTPMTGSLKFQGFKIDLDADTDTSIDASTDDQIDFEINGSDVLPLTAGKAAALDTYSAASDEANVAIYATASNEYAATAITTISRSALATTNGPEFVSLLGTTYAAEDAIEQIITAGGETSVVFSTGFQSRYRGYKIIFSKASFSGTSVFGVQVSTDGGSTWVSGASDYNQAIYRARGTTATPISTLASSDAYLPINGLLSYASGSFYSGELIISLPNSAAYKSFYAETHTRIPSGVELWLLRMYGVVKNASAINAIRFIDADGTAASFSAGGTFTLYGIN